jgi:phosphate transport system substrate-binding protein
MRKLAHSTAAFSLRGLGDEMQTGQSVGQHILLEFLGDGGMGEVWKAQHTRTGRVDAIKFLRASGGVNREISDRFLNEARVQSHLHHPNIVPVFDAFEENGISCIVMKLVDGENLEARLAKIAPGLMPIEQVLGICADVLSALDYAHTLKPLPPPAPQVGPVIHRDLKPSNILIDRNGHALLADFGIAFATNGVRLTQAGATLGTAFYMSPEQITDASKVDARSDIYSFGCVLYELLTGRPPFGSETETEYTIKTKHVKEMPVPLHKLNRDVPFELQWIVLRALNKDPDNRFASAAEMAAEIEDAFPRAKKTTPRPDRTDTLLDIVPPPVATQPVIPPPVIPPPVLPPIAPWNDQPGARSTQGGGAVSGGQTNWGQSNPGQGNPGQTGGGQTGSGQSGARQTGAGPFDARQTGGASGSGGFTAGGTAPPYQQPVVTPLIQQPGKKKPLGLWLGIVAVLLLLVGAGVWYFWPSEHIILSLKGSTSIGDELAPKLAESYLRDVLKAEQTGTTTAGKDKDGHPYLHVWGKVPGERGKQVIEIYATGSGDAFKCLAAAKDSADHCDIGMASRPINDGDKKKYPVVHALADPSTEHVLALDGIAVVVNPSNPVSQLTIPQLNAIYSGQITNWRQLGGEDTPIELFERDTHSGTRDMFNEKVMGKDSQGKVRVPSIPADHEIAGSDEIVDKVMHSTSAIAYVSSPLSGNAKALKISDGSSSPQLPTTLNVVTENYPICRRLLLYDRADADDSVNKFLKYVMSEAGQKVVSQANYVDLTPRVFHAEVPVGASEEYRTLASNYSLLGASFHFSSGQAKTAGDPSSRLDNLAEANIARVQTFLTQHGGSGDDIVLVGYADNQRGAQSFETLGMARANSVAASLDPTGVSVPSRNIRTFGAQLPVASNDTPDGRSKNRRVEVWVRNGIS